MCEKFSFKYAKALSILGKSPQLESLSEELCFLLNREPIVF
jgi:hypothetical protein